MKGGILFNRRVFSTRRADRGVSVWQQWAAFSTVAHLFVQAVPFKLCNDAAQFVGANQMPPSLSLHVLSDI